MGFEMWFLIVIGAAVAVILGSVVWIARGDAAAGKPDVSDTAMGLGIATSVTNHSHGPVDSGSTGAGSAGGDGGSSAP